LLGFDPVPPHESIEALALDARMLGRFTDVSVVVPEHIA
jgi:hypothetical protein